MPLPEQSYVGNPAMQSRHVPKTHQKRPSGSNASSQGQSSLLSTMPDRLPILWVFQHMGLRERTRTASVCKVGILRWSICVEYCVT